MSFRSLSLSFPCYLSLGSNLGDSTAILQGAVQALEGLGRVMAVSSFVRTAPMYNADQPDFLNAAVMLQTALPPFELLTALQAVEQEAGRKRTLSAPRYQARTLDIDIVYYGALVMNTPALVIPHPLRLERRFVLEPLVEIAAGFVDPMERVSLQGLLRKLPQL